MKCNPHDSCFRFLALAVLFSVLGPGYGQQYYDQECKDITGCNDPLDVLSSDQRELSALSSKDDIDRVCPSMQRHLDCIDRHTKRCMTPDEKQTFNVLYNGTIVVITELCRNESYQQEFLKYAPCMQDLKKEKDEQCDSAYKRELEEIQKDSDSGNDVDKFDTVRRVCCSFQQFLACSDNTVREKCGHEAGTFNKNMLDTMAATLIKEQCLQFPLTSRECQAISMASSRPNGASTARRAMPLLLLVLALLQSSHRT